MQPSVLIEPLKTLDNVQAYVNLARKEVVTKFIVIYNKGRLVMNKKSEEFEVIKPRLILPIQY